MILIIIEPTHLSARSFATPTKRLIRKITADLPSWFSRNGQVLACVNDPTIPAQVSSLMACVKKPPAFEIRIST